MPDCRLPSSFLPLFFLPAHHSPASPCLRSPPSSSPRKCPVRGLSPLLTPAAFTEYGIKITNNINVVLVRPLHLRCICSEKLYLSSIRKQRMRYLQFPIRKGGIFRSVKESEGLRGGVLGYAAQESPKIDTARAEKDPFRMETI